MRLIEKIQNMKKEGKNESEINNLLREEKISPRKIKESIEQAKIKDAISRGKNESE